MAYLSPYKPKILIPIQDVALKRWTKHSKPEPSKFRPPWNAELLVFSTRWTRSDIALTDALGACVDGSFIVAIARDLIYLDS